MHDMGMDGATDWREAAASALDWWREAGVDVVVADAPRDWTRRDDAQGASNAGSQAADSDAPVQGEAEAEMPLPATLEGFVDWRFGSGAPEADWGEPVLSPSGNPNAALMVLTDLPEAGDGTGGTLLGGDAGRLFDRMLAAIGEDRESIYLAPLCAARPITGQIPREAEALLARLALHHIALAAPQRVLLLGQAVSRAIVGSDSGAVRGCLQPLNYPGGQSQAIASFQPRFLLNRPAAKADAWKDLQLLIGGQTV